MDNQASGGGVVQLDTLTKTAYVSRYLELFWDAYYPHGVAGEGRGYTSAIQNLSTEDNALRLALLASSFCALAPHTPSQPWMLLEGKRLYGEALLRVNSAIRKPDAVQRTSVLATVKCLSLYEASLPSSCTDNSPKPDTTRPPTSNHYTCLGFLWVE